MQISESYVFYESFYDAMQSMSDTDFSAANRALHTYGLKGIEPNLNALSPIVRSVFVMAKPQIDANRRKRKIGKDNGSKGGAPIGNQNARKNKDTVESKTTQPLFENNANVNVNANVFTNKKEVINSDNSKRTVQHTQAPAPQAKYLCKGCGRPLKFDKVLEIWGCDWCGRSYKDSNGTLQEVDVPIF